MAKFRIGDKVRVREDLIGGEKYGGLYCNKEMEQYRGLKTIITDVDKENRYRLKDCYNWDFNDEMFEPVEEPNNVYYDKNLECYFIHIDDVTICAKKFGVSKKHPDDEYCETIGDAVAYKRFMEVLKNE